MPLKIILTGATGMVGEGVLLTALQHPDVEQVLIVNRKHFPLQHPKLRELLEVRTHRHRKVNHHRHQEPR